MRTVLREEQYSKASNFQNCEIDLLNLLKKVLSGRTNPIKPSCYFQLQKRCKLTVKAWIEDEIAELKKGPRSTDKAQNLRASKNLLKNVPSQVKIISHQEQK